jgi:hypothetical protein
MQYDPDAYQELGVGKPGYDWTGTFKEAEK